MSTQYNLADLNQLTSKQYDKAKQQTNDRILSYIGDKPTRDSFKREYGAVWSVLDIALIVVFIGALAISTQHIFDYVSSVAGTHYTQASFTTGLRLPHFWSVTVQQLGALLMAESAMIAFFTYWRVDTKDVQGVKKYAHLLFVLAVASALYVLYVNTLGVGLLYDPTSWLAPFVTIGIGVRLEQIFSELINRQSELDRRYTQALTIWERATDDMTTHPDYSKILYAEIWRALTSKSNNNDYDEAPMQFKIQAVQRELKRDNWVNEIVTDNASDKFVKTDNTNGHAVNFTQAPLVAVEALPMSANGNGKH